MKTQSNDIKIHQTFFPFTSNRNFLIVLICAIGLILGSCSGNGGNTMGPDDDNDNGDTNPPDDDDNGNESRLVSYSEDIQPIFNANCATSGCHDSGTQESGVDLSSYDAATSSNGTQYGGSIIVAGEPDASPIVDKISNDDPQEGVRMPRNADPLSSAQIDSIRAWIEDDAPDN